MVRKLAEGRSVVTQRLDPPHYEVQYRVEPAPGGTRLELTMCWPDAPVTDKGEQLRSRLAQALQQTASAYQAAIEPGGTGRSGMELKYYRAMRGSLDGSKATIPSSVATR